MKKILFLLAIVSASSFGQNATINLDDNSKDTSYYNDYYLQQNGINVELQKATSSNMDSLLVIDRDSVKYGLAADMKIKSNAFFTTDTNTYFTGVDVLMDMSVAAVALNKLRVWPIIPGRTMTFDKIAVEVTTGATGNFIFGIYTDNGNGYPDTLLFKSQVFNGASATVLTQQLTTDLVLNGNTLYFIACNNSNSSIIFRGIDAQGLPNVFGHATGEAKGARTCITVDRNYDGDLPATFPAKTATGYGYLIDNVMPALFMQQK